jgi:hypothetical protein
MSLYNQGALSLKGRLLQTCREIEKKMSFEARLKAAHFRPMDLPLLQNECRALGCIEKLP